MPRARRRRPPAGPFYVVLRNYSPKAEVVDRTWKKPAMEVTR